MLISDSKVLHGQLLTGKLITLITKNLRLSNFWQTNFGQQRLDYSGKNSVLQSERVKMVIDVYCISYHVVLIRSTELSYALLSGGHEVRTFENFYD